jgi:hypothetical protein
MVPFLSVRTDKHELPPKSRKSPESPESRQSRSSMIVIATHKRGTIKVVMLIVVIPPVAQYTSPR